MKKLISSSFIVLLLLIGTNSKSQNLKGQTVVTGSYGFTAVKSVVATLWSTDFIEASTNGIGAIALGVDYGLSDRFSVGLHYATQTVKGRVTDLYWFTDANNNAVYEDFDYRMNRTHLSIVPKIHYIVDNEKFDLYSGLRVGYVKWTKKFESKDPDFPDNYDLDINTLKNRVSVGLVLLGARYYFSDNIGGSFELNLGPPYIFSLGASYKLGGAN